MHTKQDEKVEDYKLKFKTLLGEIISDFEKSKIEFNAKTNLLLITARRIYCQKKYSDNKVYSVHAPEVECIAKGKLHKKYEFGNKVSLEATSDGSWIVGAQAFHGRPYDGHTLKKSIWQIERIANIIKNIFVDMGYRKHNYFGKAKIYIKRWLKGLMPDELWRKFNPAYFTKIAFKTS